MFDYDHAVDTATGLPVGRNLHVERITARNQIVEDLIRDGFVKDSAISEVEVVVLQRLEFYAYLVGYVLHADRSEVGESRLRADRCEFRVDVGDGESAPGSRIREGFKLHATKLRRERTTDCCCALSW